MSKKLTLGLIIFLSQCFDSKSETELTHTEKLLLELYHEQVATLKGQIKDLVESTHLVEHSIQRLTTLNDQMRLQIEQSRRIKTTFYCLLSAIAGALLHKSIYGQSGQKASLLMSIYNVIGVVLRQKPSDINTVNQQAS